MWAYVAAVVAGIPAYVCEGAQIPLTAALITKDVVVPDRIRERHVKRFRECQPLYYREMQPVIDRRVSVIVPPVRICILI